jgi:hypothetical protein
MGQELCDIRTVVQIIFSLTVDKIESNKSETGRPTREPLDGGERARRVYLKNRPDQYGNYR